MCQFKPTRPLHPRLAGNELSAGGVNTLHPPSAHGDIDLDACVVPKQMHDVSGGYNRFDIFRLTVDRTANRPVRFECEESPEDARSSADGESETKDRTDH